MTARVRDGAAVKRTNLTDEFTFEHFMERYGETAVPLFLIGARGDVSIMTVTDPPTPKAGQTLISLVDEPARTGTQR